MSELKFRVVSDLIISERPLELTSTCNGLFVPVTDLVEVAGAMKNGKCPPYPDPKLEPNGVCEKYYCRKCWGQWLKSQCEK